MYFCHYLKTTLQSDNFLFHLNVIFSLIGNWYCSCSHSSTFNTNTCVIRIICKQADYYFSLCINYKCLCLQTRQYADTKTKSTNEWCTSKARLVIWGCNCRNALVCRVAATAHCFVWNNIFQRHPTHALHFVFVHILRLNRRLFLSGNGGLMKNGFVCEYLQFNRNDK